MIVLLSSVPSGCHEWPQMSAMVSAGRRQNFRVPTFCLFVWAEFPCSHFLFVCLFSEIGSYLVGLGLGVQTRLTSNSESRLPLPPECWVKGRSHYSQLLPSGFENQSHYLGSKLTLLLVPRK